MERRDRSHRDQPLPTPARKQADAWGELDRYSRQANLSERNVARLEALGAASDPALREYAAVLREIAAIHPRRKRRWRRLARNHPDLLRRYLRAAGDDMTDEILGDMDEDDRLLLDDEDEDEIPF